MQIDTRYLAAQPFFKGLCERHLQMLARNLKPVMFEADQFIFREAEGANHFYLLLAGEVALESSPGEKEGEPCLLQMLRGGDVLGWSWLFPPYYWPVNARALTPVKAIFIPSATLCELCEHDSDFGYELMVRISQVVIQQLLAGQRRMRGERREPEPAEPALT